MFFKNQVKYHVYITQNTLRGILLEAGRHPGNESIVQMPGVRIGNDFYFDMVADSGINATYTPTMCEKDHIYADHLSTRISEYYDLSKGKLTVCQLHRHPSNCPFFSAGDFPANSKLAKQFGGVVNGLMFVDPEFRVKFWFIDEDGNYFDAVYEINDKAVNDAMPRIDLKKLKKTVERNDAAVIAKREESLKKSRSEHMGPIKERLEGLFRLTSGKEKCMENRDLDENSREYFMDFERVREALRPYRALIPKEFKESRYEGKLMGYYIPETKTFNVVTKSFSDLRTDVSVLGEAVRERHNNRQQVMERRPETLLLFWNGETPEIQVSDRPDSEVNIEYYSVQKDIFSRNTGIVEKDRMASKQAIIVGAGSGGFKVGLEMVRAGIGSVIIADDDVFAYHNVGRHECGIHDVGRYKVDCFRERAADINPDCKVYTFREQAQHVDPIELETAIQSDAIILCCADNRHCAYFCNELSDKCHVPMIDAGCGPRASTGEIYYYKPDSGMPCYTCTYGEDRGVDYTNQEVRRRFYATETELEKLHFQPGMYLDIELTAIFESKLAIDLLMEGEEGYEPKLLPYIRQCTVLLNYPIEQDVNPYMQLFGPETERRPFTWKSFPAQKNDNCTYCGCGDKAAIRDESI